MTVEEIQLAIAESHFASARLVQACQVRAAKHFEKQTEADAQKAISEMETSAYVAEKTRQQAANYMRPCIMFRPALAQEDGVWVATNGHLSATGPTPETAHQEFDRMWVGKDEL